LLRTLFYKFWIIRFFKLQDLQTKAIILNLLSIVFFSIMVIFIKKAAENLHIFEVVFFRNLLAFIIMLPIIKSIGLDALKMNNSKLFFVRGFFGAIGMFAGFSCLTLIPIAQATAISFSKPIFITLGATIFLGEIIKARRIVAIIIGFVGMLIIVQPGVEGFSFGITLAIIAAITHSINSLIVKKLTLTEAPLAIVIWMVIILIPITFIPALSVWEWPSIETWIYLWGIAIFGTLAHFSLTKSYSMAEITSLQPIEFIKLPLMALLGWGFFYEIPGIWTWIGGLVIFISTIYISRREIIVLSSLRISQGNQKSKL